MRKGRKWGVHAILSHELKPFEDEIKKCVEELDWALQMYSCTLKETGLSDLDVTNKLREVFFDIAKEIMRN